MGLSNMQIGDDHWPDGPFLDRPGPDEVHVWRIDLMTSPRAGSTLYDTLSEDEVARAARFIYDRHRDAFIAARSSLRMILGRYLARSPASLAFTYGPYGKPYLAQEGEGSGLQFNLSHAGAMALVAVVQGRDVGVDIERIEAGRAHEEIAERFFAAEEVEAFRSVPQAARVEAFFNGWTRKEAFMKASGQGLTLGLDRFCVTLRPGEPAAVLSTAWDPDEAGRWSMTALYPAPNYAAALAVEGKGLQLIRRSWGRIASE